MPRGQASKEGDTNVSANGYHYTRTQSKWRLTHHIIAEQKLGRSLEPNELVQFKDKDRTNLDPNNIHVIKKGGVSLRKRRAQVIARLEELQAELREIDAKLEQRASLGVRETSS